MEDRKIIVETPRGCVYTTKLPGGEVTAKLEFYPEAIEQMRKNFFSAQAWLDNAVLRDSEPFVPMITGALRKSGILGTVIGSGAVRYIAPYAKRKYYDVYTPSREAHPQATRMWFETAKAIYKERWLAGVKAIAGRGG